MNLRDRTTQIVLLVLFSVTFAAAFALAWWLEKPKQVIEKPAAAVRQGDGSLVLERKATTPAEDVKVPHSLPVGSTLVRETSITVKPTQQIGTQETPCEPVIVNSSLVKFADGTQRVVVSSPNGTVTGGTDIPVAPSVQRDPHWQATAMAGYDFHQRRQVFGGQVTYTRGPFVVGTGAIGGTAFASVGVRW